MPPRRRAPRNSRLGCRQCKRRGVKCDEQRPNCAKCESRLDVCEYSSSGPWLWTNAAVAGHASTEYQEAIFNESTSSRGDQESETPSGVISLTIPSRGLDTSQDMLLRHWVNVTALSISRNDTDRQIWQTLLPREALSSPYLLHGVLALTAIHLALINSLQDDQREKWIGIAEYHQSEAINLFTRTVEKNTRPKHIRDSLLSSLLMGFAFAFPLAVAGSAQRLLEPLEELIQVITFIRSTMNFSAPILTGVKSDELSRLTHVKQTKSVLTGPSYSAISRLYELNAIHMLDPADHQVFHQTISQLGDAFACIDSGLEPLAGVFMSISELPTRFHHFLLQRHPFALVIFGHYCVALHHFRWLWWISFWGERVLVAIKEKLDSEWTPFLEWALDTTGL